jgi:4-hydroxybutyrate dehydrogenase
MLMQFPRVQFDFGAIKTLPAELKALGIERPLFVTDQGLVKAGVFAAVHRAMGAPNDLAVFDTVPENPTIAGVEQATEKYKALGCDGVVAVGGGSVIDTAKAVAVLATHGGKITDYFRRADRVGPHTAPIVAVPTTAGTGSEASAGAGIHPDGHSRGSGLNSAYIVPKVAICDPELTFTLPARLTAGTGMDALSHAVEHYYAKTPNPLGDAIALDACTRVFANVERAVADGHDREARSNMMLAALAAMMCGKGLGPGHALANTFGDQGLHHGMLVTLSMPAVLRLWEEKVPEKTAPLAAALGLAPGRRPSDAVAEMNARVGLPNGVAALGYKPGDLAEMAADAQGSWFNHTAPYHPTVAEYRRLVEEALD